MEIRISDTVRLELLDEGHAQEVFKLADENRNYLRQWLPWIDAMQTEDFIISFIKGSIERYKSGTEHAFVIIKNGKIIGRVGIYYIDTYNKTGEIGYWLEEKSQGKGIVASCCKQMISYGFKTLELNRLEIKCAVANTKSQTIPERLSFKKEGVLRQAQLLHGRHIDLYLYSFIAADNNQL